MLRRTFYGTAPLDISVVVRTYTEDRWDYLVAAPESIRRQNRPPLELVVVVDHNPALLRRVCEQFPEARVVENTEPRGSSGAWNSGVMASRGRIIAFLDDDAEAEPDWLERLWKAYADDSVMGVGGSIRPVWEGAARPRWFPDEFLWVVGCTYRGLPEETAPVRNLIGCNMSFRRSAFEEIGGFRKGMGHVGGRPIGDDETEFSIRVGLRWPDRVLLHHPEARVRHKVPASRARWSYFYSRCRLEGRSKALMSGLVGTHHGLAAECTYAFRTLPRGMWRGLVDAIWGDWTGLGRAWAIFSGLAITTIHYALGVVVSSSGDHTIVPIEPVLRPDESHHKAPRRSRNAQSAGAA
ncbi:MAG: glycosyltransferase family 2 protein [Anaerolineae bacterium]|jgi:GT2 family glycosyltransferase